MKNIDKIREMTPKELAELIMCKHTCDVCAFQLYEDCEGMDCEEGIVAWLEKESEITIRDIERESEKFCVGECKHCQYANAVDCKTNWLVDNFNIINGKIERRK
jgi:hypothetical protein